MLENGYIKLHRSIVKWEWWSNRNTRDLFIYLLIVANISDSRFEGHVIKRGSLVCSLPTLSAESGLTIQEVRTALKHLKSTGELTVEKNSKFSIITINNYDKFQTPTGELTVNQQSSNSQSTVNQQYNKKNKEDKEDKEDKYTYVISLFNSICKSLPRIQKITESRKRAIKSADKQLDGDFESLFKAVEQSDFLIGRNKEWKCSFDWILKPANLIKIIEGNYSNRSDGNGNAEKSDSKQDTEHKYGEWL